MRISAGTTPRERSVTMHMDEVAPALAKAGLSKIAQSLPSLLRPSIRLTAQPADESALATGASKLGGAPDLPHGAQWPSGKGAPLSFIAQIRLEDVHAFAAASALPPAGLLSFFYDAKQSTYGADPADRGGWQVIFTPPSQAASLARVAPPLGLPTSAWFTACALSFSEEATLPAQLALDASTVAWTASDQTAYEQFLTTFTAQADPKQPRNRLLGHPDTIQDDMRIECQLAANGVSDANDPRAKALQPGALNWRLLLQVDSDFHAGMRWSDAGMLYFWIEDAALRAGKFDNTWAVLQSD
jgi:uncharacterized protein YwqG